MRLTVVSHSCIVDTNQQFFAALEELGVVVQIIVPERWVSDLGGQPMAPTRWEGLRTGLSPLPVVMPGKVPLHAYTGSLTKQFYLFQPDAIYVENESYAVSTAQVAIANRLSMRRPLLFRNNQNIKKDYPWPFSVSERYVLSQAACACLINEDAGQILRDKGFKGRLAYMPYGVDPQFHRPYDARALRESLGLKGFVFGYMGRLVSEKGLGDLLDAFGTFHPEEDVSLLVVGDGPLRTELESRMATPAWQGRVRWMPAVPHRDVPLTMSALDALVLPSRSTPTWREQFGRVLIEAAACGVPTIGSDSGEIPKLIGRLESGLVYPEGQVGELASRMRQMVAEPTLHHRLRERGRTEVEEQYGYEALAYRFRQLLESVVSQGRRARYGEEVPAEWVEDG